MWWVIHMCRGFDPLFSLWQDRARSFGGVFSHPPTQKRSFGYKYSQNSIFLAPKYHFSLDLFGSNFQWPAAHPQQFSDRVPPPGDSPCSSVRLQWIYFTIWEKGKEELSPLQYHFKSLHIISRHYKKSLLRSQIYHGYEELSTDTNYPIWRRQKLPYMKKTRKKKQVCGAACFMAAEIKFSEDVRPSVRPSVRPWVGVRMITLILFSGFKIFFLHISLGSRSCMGLNISVLPH